MWHHGFEKHIAFDLWVEMLVISYQTTRLHDPKGHIINLHRSETSDVTHISTIGVSKHLPM